MLERFKEQLAAMDRELSRQDFALKAAGSSAAALGDITFAIAGERIEEIAHACDVKPSHAPAANALRA